MDRVKNACEVSVGFGWERGGGVVFFEQPFVWEVKTWRRFVDKFGIIFRWLYKRDNNNKVSREGDSGDNNKRVPKMQLGAGAEVDCWATDGIRIKWVKRIVATIGVEFSMITYKLIDFI